MQYHYLRLSRSRKIASDFPYVELHVAGHAGIEISSRSAKRSTKAIEHVESADVFINAGYRTRKATRTANTIKRGIPKLCELNPIASCVSVAASCRRRTRHRDQVGGPFTAFDSTRKSYSSSSEGAQQLLR